MGDRTYCSLQIWKTTHIAEFEELIKLLNDELGGWNDHHDINEFSFDEVNYGSLPDGISDWLRNNGFSYLWNWDSGDEYGPGFEVYDSDLKKFFQGNTDTFGELVLAVSEAQDPEKLKEAIFWNVWPKNANKTFGIIDSPSPEFSMSIGEKEVSNA